MSRCPFEGAGDRFDRRVEHGGHLVRVDVAKDEHGELPWWQGLQRCHEGKGDGLGLFVAGLWPRRRVNRTVDERIGRLQPYDLAQAGRLGRLNFGDGPCNGRAPLGGTKRVEAAVGGDAEEPCAERGALLKASKASPGSKKRLLQSVLCILDGPEHPVAVHLKLATVFLGQLPKRVTIARPRSLVRKSVLTAATPSLSSGTSRVSEGR
jgi:hypothetical protein